MYVFFDTETGGLTPEFSLLTLSAIVTDENFNIIPTYGFDPGVYVRVKHAPYVTHPKAMEVNNIKLADNDEHGFTVAETKEILVPFLKEAIAVTGVNKLIPAGHNFPFDMRFLQAYLLPDNEWRNYFTHPALDTCASARLMLSAKLIEGGCGLPYLRRLFNIQTGVEHNAESDNLASIAVAKKFKELLARKKASA
ncbi:3'-5' exonuclease [bacterium]|nr:3'-5' exonuclease [bacterium]